MLDPQSGRPRPRRLPLIGTNARPFLLSFFCLVLTGCDRADYPAFFANGPVALTERNLMIAAIGLMLIVVVPVFVMAIWFPIKYRASNKDSTYRPHWSYSRRAEIFIWVVPAAIVLAIGSLVWIYSHRLDPYRSSATGGRPLAVQAISLDWNWLFIYPDKGIATVNELVLPAHRAIAMRLTSDTVMNAFSVPGLVSQIYAMPGMRTKLNFPTGKTTNLTGRNMQFSGDGFPDQRFSVRVLTPDSFADWVANMREAPEVLDRKRYMQIAHQRKTSIPLHFSRADGQLFPSIIARYHTALPTRPSPSPQKEK